MRILPVNLNAFLVELDDLDQAMALLASLRAEPVPGIVDLVPAARTLLVRLQPEAQDLAAVVGAIAGRDTGAAAVRGGTLIEIPVRYDGEDLAEVAGTLGMPLEEVIRRHTGSEYTVAFTGFAPGFGYLAGGDPALNVPRRRTPRTRIPAGAVALAGNFSGVYPQSSPGGWQIIGTTDLAMWDLERDPPALLQPGSRVRFVDLARASATRRADRASAPSPRPVDAAPADSARALEVLDAGLQTLFQDLGRTGHAHLGVSASGAMDRAAFKAANRLVGNAPDTPCLETYRGGLRVRSRGENVVAATGADAPLAVESRDGGRWAVPRHQPVALADGDVFSIDEPASGARCYLAVRGGFAVERVLGSSATDTLARIGPPPVAAGRALPVRSASAAAVVGHGESPPDGLPAAGAEVVLDVVLGPRTDWFTPEAVALLRSQRWRVTPQSDRVGIRLAGERSLAWAVPGELPSEGTVAGAIQVPPSGQPVLFLADHPLTGGYPVIGCVATHHLDLAGQVPAGAWIRFHPLRPFALLASGPMPAAAQPGAKEDER